MIADKWYGKAAEQGDVAAQFYLGMCYENGYGLDKNDKEAAKWYAKAEAQGSPSARQALKRLREKK